MLIQATKIDKRFGPTVIFEEASVAIERGDKIGVIGRNGAGKSTFCRMLLGSEEPDGGTLDLSPELRLGYLAQDAPFREGESVAAFLERSSGRESWRCAKIAARLGLRGETLESEVVRLPGGYQTRVKIAAMLLDDPNFLVLDEPTNYLDLSTVILVERFLRDYAGGFLLVSHDREFLKRTCEKTLEVERGGMRLFPGGVEEFLAFKEEEVEQAERHNKNVEAKRKQLQDFVDRYRVRASTASRAQAKLKQMDRLHTIEIEHPMSTVRIRMPEVAARKGTALRCEELSIGYGEHVVARDIRCDVERGEKIAVLGDNGQGKSTFLRTVASRLPRLGGEFKWAQGVACDFYAQHVYSSLPADRTVEEYLTSAADSDVPRQEILDMAGSFLFRGDDVRKPVGVLSGGERARLCLAGILLGRSEALLLDEPTNHLDFETVEALAEALRQYAGTVLFVSHDRTFVSRVASGILEVASGRIAVWPGDYDSYVWKLERDAANDEGADAADAGRKRSTAAPNEWQLRKERRSKLGKLRRRAKDAEEALAKLEEEKREIERFYLENPTEYSHERQTRLEALGGLIAEQEASWLELGEEIEGLEREDEDAPR